jgi:hypothetical protein
LPGKKLLICENIGFEDTPVNSKPEAINFSDLERYVRKVVRDPWIEKEI